MGELAEQTEARLQGAQPWLAVLRGMSLAPPAIWNGTAPYIKDIAQTDIVNSISAIKYPSFPLTLFLVASLPFFLDVLTYTDVQDVLSKGVQQTFLSASLSTTQMTNATIFKMVC